MAEILGIVAAVTQLVHFSGELLTVGYGFLSKISRAPLEIRDLLTESAALNSLLSHIQLLAESSPGTGALQALQQSGVLKDCQDSLIGVKRALEACQKLEGYDGSKTENLRRRIKWPFKERETKEAIQRLTRLRGLLSSALNTDSA
jgi:hypothetical protein